VPLKYSDVPPYPFGGHQLGWLLSLHSFQRGESRRKPFPSLSSVWICLKRLMRASAESGVDLLYAPERICSNCLSATFASIVVVDNMFADVFRAVHFWMRNERNCGINIPSMLHAANPLIIRCATGGPSSWMHSDGVRMNDSHY